MKELPAAIITSVACLMVPIQMAGQTWDDQRSVRQIRLSRFWTKLFWCHYRKAVIPSYLQMEITIHSRYGTIKKTEGFRTDARTCNLSYLQTDWYIDQMKRPAYDSPSLPITWDRVEYGRNQRIHFYSSGNKKSDWRIVRQADSSSNPESK